MAAINWDENLSVKIDSIDLQHKKLIDMINSFYENINQDTQKVEMLELINSLKEYTVFHFSTEEKYMQQTNFPDFENHKSEHDKFVATVLDFEERFKNGKFLLTFEVTNFIKEWVAKHIMGADKKYTDYFIKNGIN
jgi:hemerythrin